MNLGTMFCASFVLAVDEILNSPPNNTDADYLCPALHLLSTHIFICDLLIRVVQDFFILTAS
jgi:hypothetical protein